MRKARRKNMFIRPNREEIRRVAVFWSSMLLASSFVDCALQASDTVEVKIANAM